MAAGLRPAVPGIQYRMLKSLFYINLIRCLFWILFQLAGLAVFAQKQQLRFEHLGPAQGLSQSNATCILQDSRGFMWVGTQDGLNRYDGYAFTIYKNIIADAYSLSNNSIKNILEDSRGNIWIATWGGGLDRFDREKNRFVHYKHDPKNVHSLSDDFTDCIMEDKEGNLWIGTYQGGLNRMDPHTGRFSVYTHNPGDSNSLSDNYIITVFEDSRHRIWAGTSGSGLNLLDVTTGRFTRLQHNDRVKGSLAHNTVTSLYEDKDHHLWIGTRGGGLDLLEETGGFRHFKNDPHNPNSLARDVVYCLVEDDRNNLWVGTENGGLSILNLRTGVFTNYKHDDIDNTSLSNNSIYSFCKDVQNNIWVGTYSGGINLCNRTANQFACYRHGSDPKGLGNNSILNFGENPDGRIWIATDGGGADLFDPQKGEFTHFTHRRNDPNSICGNYVLCIQKDADNNIWMGTCMDGTTVYNPSKGTFRQIKNRPGDPSSISGDNVPVMTLDKDKELWIGTYGGGLNLYDRGKGSFLRYQHDSTNANTISSDRVSCLLADSEGGLWIGTFDHGLDRFDKKTKTFTHYRHGNSNSLSSNSINAIFEDHQHNLWICTAAGLNFLDKNTGHITVYSTKEGLPGAMIFGILEDHKRNLWLSTNNGLSRFNPVSKVFMNFSEANGLQSNEFKAHSCFKSASGALYFGGVNGFNAFVPDSIKEISFTPPLVITGFQIFNKEVPISSGDTLVSPLKKAITETREIKLTYQSSVLSFAFASLNYTIPEKKQYAYLLEGFDKKWNYIGSRRTATYTNLDPGDYVFKVKGLNNDGSWSPGTTDIRLTITPPFWQTWWFRVLVILGIAGAAVSIHKFRMSAIQGQKKKLEQQVASLLDKAVAQGKHEIASDFLHDIGNAVVGFGSYLTRIRRLLEENNRPDLQNLAGFFEAQRSVMVIAIGEAKADAVVTLLNSIGQTQSNNLEEIRNSITEQLNIITRIQEILNIQRQYISGTESQERKPVNLRSIINDCMSMLFASVDNNAIAVSLDFQDEQSDIKGDRTRLMQLMLNILKNSIEALGTNAPIKTISLRMQRQADLLTLQVRDSGCGFDEATAGRLFERGFTTKASGAGLGLYNCRTIVESHEGSITLTSEGPGKGALTTVQFKV